MWERVRAQIDSGAIDAVDPREIAKALETKEMEISNRGMGYVAANGSCIKNYGEKKVVGYADDGESVSASPMPRRQKGAAFSSQSELGRQLDRVGRRQKSRAEQGDRPKDKDQLRGGAARRAPVAAVKG